MKTSILKLTTASILSAYSLVFSSIAEASDINVVIERLPNIGIQKITINSNKPNQNVFFNGQDAGQTDGAGMFMCQGSDPFCPLPADSIKGLMIGDGPNKKRFKDFRSSGRMFSMDKEDAWSNSNGEGDIEGSPGNETGGIFSFSLENLDFYNKSLILKNDAVINLETVNFSVSGELIPITSDFFEVAIENYELDVVDFNIPSLGLFNVDKFTLDKSIASVPGTFSVTSTTGELYTSINVNWLNTQGKIVAKGYELFEIGLNESSSGVTDITISSQDGFIKTTPEPTAILGLLVFSGVGLLNSKKN
ncbi:hypothetical protein [Okeania sp. SIO2B3]|uniref:hypothetical protein n=1 Tax=Okeania sp. SIO2B3 TaxID=2607784 RepID=UPI0013BF69FE|nr:hypothetical protein [Okeania sp. SIO2B3]NET44752.1 hypothetical protein [Okeania sp. SIO2B3]